MVMVVLPTDGGEKTTEHEAVCDAVEGKFIQLFSLDDVQMYFIDAGEHGATKQDTTTLRLVMIPHEDETPLSEVVIPPAFLEAGGWFYPLILSKTPVYRTEEKYYIFPDLLSSPGASVGIVLPEKISADERDLFEDVLLNLAGLEEFPNDFGNKFENPERSITNFDALYAHSDKSQPDGTTSSTVAEAGAGGCMPDSISLGGQSTVEFMSYETGEAKFHLSSSYHDPDPPEEHTGNPIEVSGNEMSRLAYATSKLAVFMLYYNNSASSSDMPPADDQTVKSRTIEPTEVTAVEKDPMRLAYAALHTAGRMLAHLITHIHVMDYRMRDWKNSTHNGIWSQSIAALDNN